MIFLESSVRLINFKVTSFEIICLTDKDQSRTVYIYNLRAGKVIQEIHFRNPECKKKLKFSKLVMEYYQLRSISVSDESRFLMLGGWTKSKKNSKKYPFVSFYIKKKRNLYIQTGTSILHEMEGTLTILEFLPKKQDGNIFFMAFDSNGNFSVHRTNGVQFDQVFYKEKYHDGKFIIFF